MIAAMEQYTHLLIPADPQFTPAYPLIAVYIDLLAERWNYQVNWQDQYLPGIRLVWITGEPRVEVDERAGKQFTMMPRSRSVKIERIEGIPRALEANPDALKAQRGCVLAVNGLWGSRKLPITIPSSEWPENALEYGCGLSFDLLPETVCTSDWWGGKRR